MAFPSNREAYRGRCLIKLVVSSEGCQTNIAVWLNVTLVGQRANRKSGGLLPLYYSNDVVVRILTIVWVADNGTPARWVVGKATRRSNMRLVFCWSSDR